MAKTVTTTIDDIGVSEGTETVSFGLDGVSHEVDLTKANADALREALSPDVDHGLRVSGRHRGSQPTGAQRATAGSNSTARTRAAAMISTCPRRSVSRKSIVAQWEAADSPHLRPRTARRTNDGCPALA